jgi:hypothetical protein
MKIEKLGAKQIAQYKGIKIYASDFPAKKTGKDRIYISLRQEKPKAWKVFASLCYVNAVDIRLEK